MPFLDQDNIDLLLTTFIGIRYIMDQLDSLKQEIAKAEVILAESQENFEKKPDDYSARLLLMSMENHMADLLKRLDSIEKI